jgi:4'-phosphopantetheinyl transferase
MSGEQISLYVGHLDTVDTPTVYRTCVSTLSPAEKRRAEGFVFDHLRRRYIFAHGLVRLALSSFIPEIEPSDWSFVTNRYGRPFVASPAIARTVYFSLSHTEGCVSCAVSDCEAVGIDVETIREFRSLITIACSNFSPEEIDTLRSVPSSDLVDRFFDYWTLKEAYLKARSVGLNFPLNQFSILISSSREIGIRLMPNLADDTRKWHFTTISPSARYRLAVADGSGVAGGLPIFVQPWPTHQTMPLHDETLQGQSSW